MKTEEIKPEFTTSEIQEIDLAVKSFPVAFPNRSAFVRFACLSLLRGAISDSIKMETDLIARISKSISDDRESLDLQPPRATSQEPSEK